MSRDALLIRRTRRNQISEIPSPLPTSNSRSADRVCKERSRRFQRDSDPNPVPELAAQVRRCAAFRRRVSQNPSSMSLTLCKAVSTAFSIAARVSADASGGNRLHRLVAAVTDQVVAEEVSGVLGAIDWIGTPIGIEAQDGI